jgi:hypothetical protein
MEEEHIYSPKDIPSMEMNDNLDQYLDMGQEDIFEQPAWPSAGKSLDEIADDSLGLASKTRKIPQKSKQGVSANIDKKNWNKRTAKVYEILQDKVLQSSEVNEIIFNINFYLSYF